MSTDLDLDHIRSLHAGITPGPHILDRYDHGGGRMYAEKEGGGRTLIIDTFGSEGNREFFAAAPSMVAHLLAVVERVEALAANWDLVHEAFPRSDGGILAKAHANRLRAAINSRTKDEDES